MSDIATLTAEYNQLKAEIAERNAKANAVGRKLNDLRTAEALRKRLKLDRMTPAERAKLQAIVSAGLETKTETQKS